MKPSKEAKAQGYAEVIYLDVETHTDIEEVGAANFFCIKDDVLYTPLNSQEPSFPVSRETPSFNWLDTLATMSSKGRCC